MRYKCIVSYDGTNFHGFQVQENLRTVQMEIEKVLEIMLKQKIIIYASGRTDAYVHAIGQVFHFDCDIDINEWNMKSAINSMLPKDIYVCSVEKVNSDFHSRFSAIKKEYHYVIGLNEYCPLNANYVYYPNYRNIDYKRMEEASVVFVGEHDFKSFSKSSDIKNTVRTIYSIDFVYENDKLIIKIMGNGFLHNMVRVIVGMLFEVGRNHYDKNYLENALLMKDRKYCPKIAPATGLYLYKVYYE